MSDEPLAREREPIERVRARLEALVMANAAPRYGARSKRTGRDMIEDIFARRYDEVLEFSLDTAQNVIGPVLIQAAQIFFDDIQPVLLLPDSFFQKLNQKLAR